jgi:small subunit ribosomal protein S17e
VDRVRRLSQEIVLKYPDMFGTDFEANKEQLAKVAIVHSKMLRNKIVGKITKNKIRESAEKEERLQEVAAAAAGQAPPPPEAAQITEETP